MVLVRLRAHSQRGRRVRADSLGPARSRGPVRANCDVMLGDSRSGFSKPPFLILAVLVRFLYIHICPCQVTRIADEK